MLGILNTMLVCSCHAVNDVAIEQAVATGAACLDSVGEACGAGRDCGGCHTLIEAILAEMDRHLDRSNAA
ncbi:MAG: (2Fe-2S)-binding protein [Acidimicrobiales bacterium]